MTQDMSELTVNVLTRTSSRPRYFERCVASVHGQKYKKVKHIVATDDVDSVRYIEAANLNPILLSGNRSRRLEAGIFSAPYNLHFNFMYHFCEPGLVMFLDDDDEFVDDESVSNIVNIWESSGRGLSRFLIWKVGFPERIIPSYSFGKSISPRDISGIGFAFPTELIWAAQWDEVKESDFRVAQKLSLVAKETIWFDRVLTKLQRSSGMGGFGSRDDI